MAFKSWQIEDGAVSESKLDTATQAKINAGGTTSAVEVRGVDGAVTAADNGKHLLVPSGSTVNLTMDAALSDGFEITITAEPNAEVTLTPPAGEQLANGTQPPTYLAADTPVVSPKLANGDTTSVSTGRWKHYSAGNKWLPVIAPLGWDVAPAQTLFWADVALLDVGYEDQTGTPPVPGAGGDPTTYGLFVGDPQQPNLGQPVPFDALGSEKNVLLNNVTIVSNGSGIALPYTDPTTGLEVTAIDTAQGQITFQQGAGPGGNAPLEVQRAVDSVAEITVTIQVAAAPSATQLQVADLNSVNGLDGTNILNGDVGDYTIDMLDSDTASVVLGVWDSATAGYTDGPAQPLSGVYLRAAPAGAMGDISLSGGLDVNPESDPADWNAGGPAPLTCTLQTSRVIPDGQSEEWWVDTDGNLYLKKDTAGTQFDFATAVANGAI